MKVGGVTSADLKALHGTHDLGWNATGLIRSYLHVDADEIIIREVMPGAVVDEIMAQVARFADQVRNRVAGQEIVGSVPLPIYAAWLLEWKRGPKAQGVTKSAFMTSKLMDRDYSRFKVPRPKQLLGFTQPKPGKLITKAN